MGLFTKIEKLEDSEEFKNWKKDHEKAYLVHAFIMLDSANIDAPQVGYFDPETHLISVFVVGESITKNEDSEVFQEQKKLVNELNVETVKVTEEGAIEMNDYSYAPYGEFDKYFTKDCKLKQNVDDEKQNDDIEIIVE